MSLSLVLRWDYRLGSTLFLVYSRAQESLPWSEGLPPSLSQLPSVLWKGPARDQLLLKWSSWWDL